MDKDSKPLGLLRNLYRIGKGYSDIYLPLRHLHVKTLNAEVLLETLENKKELCSSKEIWPFPHTRNEGCPYVFQRYQLTPLSRSPQEY